jgi:proteasome assembly chaperone (PAC2) family protein
MDRDLRHPWLVAAWPGMGVVGFGAAAHLVTALDAKPIAEVAPQGYFDLERVQVSRGVLKRVRLPRTVFHSWRDPAGRRDLLVLLGEAQPQARGYEFCEEVLRTARDLGVERVVTFAAMAAVIDPRAEPRVLAVTTAPEAALHDELRRASVSVLEEGEIGGLNGVILAAAAAYGLPGVCLLGEFPYFATSLPNPKASRAVVQAFSRLAGIGVDVSALDTEAEEVERGMVELLEKLEQEVDEGKEGSAASPAAEDEDDADDLEDEDEGEPTEPGARAAGQRRIEALFERARTDRRAALELKAELDRLGLFKKYEDRFLDLFKRAE